MFRALPTVRSYRSSVAWIERSDIRETMLAYTPRPVSWSLLSGNFGPDPLAQPGLK
jgi:hypothetical protein